jgi:hypothetical protein
MVGLDITAAISGIKVIVGLDIVRLDMISAISGI